MRFMVIVKADKDSEAGVMPSEKIRRAIEKRALDEAAKRT